MINTIKKFFKKITKYIYSSIFLLSLLIITLLFTKDKIIEGFNCSNLKIKIEIQFVVDEYDETNPKLITKEFQDSDKSLKIEKDIPFIHIPSDKIPNIENL